MNIFNNALNSGSLLNDTTISYWFSDDFSTWNAHEQTQFTASHQVWEDVTNITFVPAASQASADFVYYSVSDATMSALTGQSGVLGFFSLPNGGQQGGFFNWQATGWDDQNTNGGLAQGGYGWVTIIHEIGHGLSLSHPHDGVVFPGVTNSADTGSFGYNQGVFTTMSYNDGLVSNGLNPSATPGYG